MALKTDYKDAIPASGTMRKYKQIDNGDGTISFQDVTEYSQVGDKAAASVFNGIGEEVNGKVPTTRKINGHTLDADVTVTKSDVGLGNVDNTADANKSVSYSTSSGTSTYAHYPSHAVGTSDFGLRGNYISSASPSGGSDGDTWDQV